MSTARMGCGIGGHELLFCSRLLVYRSGITVRYYACLSRCVYFHGRVLSIVHTA